MKILYRILLVVGILATIFVIFLWYMGFFETVKAVEKIEGGYIVVGKTVVGPYSKAGIYMTEVDNNLKDLGVYSTKGFGIYYDDPKVTPEDECRSLVGNILDLNEFDKIKNNELKGLKIDSIPKTKALVIEFPIKNSMSYMLGAMKAYPEISRLMNEKNYKPVLSFEIYDIPQKKIIYVMQYSL